MSVIVIKALSIMMKTLAKPLASWMAYYNKIILKDSTKEHHIFIKKRLTNIGQSYNYYHTKLNRAILRQKTTEPIKLLSKEKALEKGIEFSSEVFMYSILIGIPLYELNKAQKAKYEKKLNIKIEKLRMSAGLESINKDLKKLEKILDNDLYLKLNQLKKLQTEI